MNEYIQRLRFMQADPATFRFLPKFTFWYLCIPLPALPYSKVPLLGFPKHDACAALRALCYRRHAG